MANAVYDPFRQKCLIAGTSHVSWSTMTIKVAFMSTKYAFAASDAFLSGVIGAGSSKLVKRSTTALASKTVTNGVAGAANLTLVAVSGSKVNSIVIYQDSGADATSAVIAYIDQATGLPFTPSGSNVTIAWSTGANKIFKL